MQMLICVACCFESFYAKIELTSEVIAQELAKRNELLAVEQQRKEQMKKLVVEIIGAILVIAFLGSIFEEWNRIWYEFGQNIYNWTH